MDHASDPGESKSRILQIGGCLFSVSAFLFQYIFHVRLMYSEFERKDNEIYTKNRQITCVYVSGTSYLHTNKHHVTKLSANVAKLRLSKKKIFDKT